MGDTVHFNIIEFCYAAHWETFDGKIVIVKFVAHHGILGDKVNARTLYSRTLIQKNWLEHVSCVLVTCLIDLAAIVSLRTIEAKERVKILIATLHETTQWPCQFYDTLLKVEVAFDLYMEREIWAY